jgi:hypothetical protein
MKRLRFIFGILITGTMFAQNDVSYTMLNQTQNALLDRYGIDYTGAHVRNMMLTGKYKKLSDSMQVEFSTAYNKFKTWNANYNLIELPDATDTMFYLASMQTYLSNKKLTSYIVATDVVVLQTVTIPIDDVENNIRTIDISETYDLNCQCRVDIMILVQDYSDTWTRIFEDASIDCAQCSTP